MSLAELWNQLIQQKKDKEIEKIEKETLKYHNLWTTAKDLNEIFGKQEFALTDGGFLVFKPSTKSEKIVDTDNNESISINTTTGNFLGYVTPYKYYAYIYKSYPAIVVKIKHIPRKIVKLFSH